MKKIAYGIIGCGAAARYHARAILQSRESVLGAIFDADPKKANEFGRRFGGQIKSSLEEMLEDPAIRAVIVSTPHDTHTELVLKTLASGKFCLAEKPLYLTTRERKAMEKVAESKKIMVVFQVRFHEPVQFLLKSVKNGLLGKVQFCSLTVRKNRDKKYFSDWHGDQARAGGMLLNQGMHGLDLIREICGAPAKSSGIVRNIRKMGEIEDLYVGQVKFSGGAIGNIEMTTSARDERPENSILVIGSRGSVKIGGGIFDHVEYAHFDGRQTGPLPKKDDNGYQKYLAAVNDLILRGKKHPFLPFAKQGILAGRFAFLLYKTAQDA